jgi:hypothetical protein
MVYKPIFVALIDAAEGDPKKRRPYKPRQPAQISNWVTTTFAPAWVVL